MQSMTDLLTNARPPPYPVPHPLTNIVPPTLPHPLTITEPTPAGHALTHIEILLLH